jgi:hypothetical protein
MHSNIALHDYLYKLLGAGAHVLELGAGEGTVALQDRFMRVTSVEHNPEYLGLADRVTYVHAPLVPYSDRYFYDATEWYDPEVIKSISPDYDAILVDGPAGFPSGRGGFYTYLDLFKRDCIITFDDIHRKWEFRLMGMVAQKLGKTATVHPGTSGRKWFGVIR